MFFKKKLITNSIDLSPKCSICGSFCVTIEIVEKNAYPVGANNWNRTTLRNYNKYRDFGSAYLRYSGLGGNNGDLGDPLSEERQRALKTAFANPYDIEEIRKEFYDMAGYCDSCNKFYCMNHWNISNSGFGQCPEGHRKSLDPHWSPE